MHENQTVVVRRKTIVDDHVLPLAEAPEAEVEGAAVSVAEALVLRHDLVEELLVGGETSHGSKKPTVT